MWVEDFNVEDKKFTRRDLYRIYMHSPQWSFKRRAVLARDKYQCTKCGTKRNLDVHHLSYERFGNEELSDLVTLCRKHHKEQHKKDKVNKNVC